jgi:hypothetical protein
VNVSGRAERAEEPATFFGVRCRSFAREPRQRWLERTTSSEIEESKIVRRRSLSLTASAIIELSSESLPSSNVPALQRLLQATHQEIPLRMTRPELVEEGLGGKAYPERVTDLLVRVRAVSPA